VSEPPERTTSTYQPPPERTGPVYRDGSTRPRNGAGVAALVTGIIALIFAIVIILAPFGLILGIAAVILGIVGVSRVSSGVADNRGQAVTGLVTGALAIFLVIFLGIGIFGLLADNGSAFRRFGTCMRNADTDGEHGQCFRDLGNELEDE
jgi:hypothetical protein